MVELPKVINVGEGVVVGVVPPDEELEELLLDDEELDELEELLDDDELLEDELEELLLDDDELDELPLDTPVMIAPVEEVKEFVIFEIEATWVALVRIIGDCLAVRIFIVQVPKTPEPLRGLVGWDPKVTAIAPLACVSGTRIIGNTAPGVKLTI